MAAGHLRGKAAEYLRLAHLIVMAERLERQAEEIDKQFENAAAPGRQDEAGNSESDGPDV